MNPEVSTPKAQTVRVIQDEQGQTVLMFVLFMIVLFVFIGLGVDLGFAYITRARLSKAVDAACLSGMRNLFQGEAQASVIASNAFLTNYGTSGRDVARPQLNIVFNTVNKNIAIDVAATVSINTYFIRVLPQWKILTVGSSGEATRADVIMSLVLDVSGSMINDGGIAGLKTAVPNFVNQFDDTNDQVAMITFSSGATTPVPMTHPFRATIDTAVSGLNGVNWTCSERGLTNGLAQIEATPVVAGQNVIKVLVFFTDGLANTWYWPGFNCGPRDMAPDKTLYDPNTLNTFETNGCTVPGTITSIDPSLGTINTSDQCGDMYKEAEARARAIATLARSQGDVVYAIGFGDPVNGTPECGHPPLNIAFLDALANTPDSPYYDSTQPSGDVAVGSNAAEIDELFETIASKILLRLSK